MEINKITGNKLEVIGSVSTIQNYQSIKEEVEMMISMGEDRITILFKDTPSLTSSIIGYFIKTITINDVKMTIEVANRQLYELLDQLNLTTTFNVVKV